VYSLAVMAKMQGGEEFLTPLVLHLLVERPVSLPHLRAPEHHPGKVEHPIP